MNMKISKNNSFLNQLYEYRNSKKIALCHNDISVTYAELYRVSYNNSLFIANSTDKVVGLYIDDGIDFVIGLLSILLSGKTALIINKNYKQQNIESLLDMCNSKSIITDNYFTSTMLIYKIDLKPYIGEMNPPRNEEEDIAIITSTSGTTGVNKLVALSYNNLINRILNTQKYYPRESSGRELIMSPLSFTIGCQQQLLTCLYFSVEIIFCFELITPRKLISYINTMDINYTSLIPGFLSILVNYLENKRIEIVNLKKIFIAGDMLDNKLLQKAIDILAPVNLYQGYGMSEMAPIAIQNYNSKDYKVGSVGKPVDTAQIFIMNSDNSVKKGELGEICVIDANTVSGYYNEIDKGSILLRTGDYGYIDSNGYLYIIGRIKNIIIISGKNVNPEEIEKEIRMIPEIEDVRVSGYKHSIQGECIKAQIVYKKNAYISPLDIKKYCNLHLPTYKVPQYIEIKDAIYKTSTGKIERGYNND